MELEYENEDGTKGAVVRVSDTHIRYVGNTYMIPYTAPVIEAFSNYLTAARERGSKDGDEIASVIWNPGILVLGPKNRPHTDPETKKKNRISTDFDNIFKVSEDVNEFQHFDDSQKGYLELDILKNLQTSNDENARVTLALIRKALKDINHIISINYTNDTQFITESTNIFISFWSNWLNLLHNGYLVYLWSASTHKNGTSYSPTHYCFNLSRNVKINEQNKTNILKDYSK
ncbi:MAG TPA: hypothetical protein LFW21_07140 [Rickettsia endosymbiont of Pyrocoelia pectoralis]|nr:hypothetical protein [Rickettsia endosymbiont of Pyrocoelia pectoralis]